MPTRFPTSSSIAAFCSTPSPNGAPTSKSSVVRCSLSGLPPGCSPSWMRLKSRVMRFCTARCKSRRARARLPRSPSSLPCTPPPYVSFTCSTSRGARPSSRASVPEGRSAAACSMKDTSSAAEKSAMATRVGKRDSKEGSMRLMRARPEAEPRTTAAVVPPLSAPPKEAVSERKASRESASTSQSTTAMHPRFAAATRALSISPGSLLEASSAPSTQTTSSREMTPQARRKRA
mmetsp:Transcript_95788/g.309254  ORF Transcript_95788/g.309254 Transcript_95788/m.309254 type:complete len:233 (+) Transcript_95788:2519-3217(+)